MSSQVQGIAGSRYASAGETYVLISGYDIYDRDFYKKLMKKVPRHGALTWMRAVKGYMSKRKAHNRTYYYHEEGQWMSAAATIASVVDNSSSIDVTLSAADHEDSGANSYPIVGDMVVFEDENCGLVTVVTRTVASAHVVTVKPVDSTVTTLAASAIAGTSMVFYSNAQKERSTKRSTRVPKTSKVTNYIQTFRQDYEVTDHAEQVETEFEYMGQKFLHVKGIDDTADRFMMEEDLGLLINPASSSLTDAGSNAIQLAKGLIPQITDSGNTLEYFGTPDMTTIDDAILILNRSFGDHEYVVGEGINVQLGWKNWLIDFAKGGDNNISFNAFDGGQKQALSMDFKSISIAPYTFHFQQWDILSHSDSLGAGSMPYKDMAVFIPTGKTKNPVADEGFGDMEPYLQIVYSRIPGAANENKGDYKMWESGGNARTGATSDEAVRIISMMSWKSLEVRRRNAFLVMRKAA